MDHDGVSPPSHLRTSTGLLLTGGDLVVQTLASLGVRAVVGLPGQHALGLFDALRRSPIALLTARVENNAGFMADGLARSSRSVAPLLLSTGPGALTALAALQEAHASSIPVLAVSAQIPTPGLGGGKHGYLHELDDQSACFAQVVKGSYTVRAVEQISWVVAHAAATSIAPPAGPVLVEIPQDLLLAAAHGLAASRRPLDAPPTRSSLEHAAIEHAAIEHAAELLNRAERPVILAGGGVSRSNAQAVLIEVADRLDAPVFTTFGGKDAFPPEHRLAAGSALEDVAVTDYLESADVLLVIGSGLGELTTNYHTLQPRGEIVHVDADPRRLGANYRCHAVAANARDALTQLCALLDPRTRQDQVSEITRVTAAVHEHLNRQGLSTEQRLLSELRTAVPDDVPTFWDMTILAYWAWSHWDCRTAPFASAQGSGGLGYAFPAALGSAFGHRTTGDDRPVLAVSGDGGAMYGISELAVAAQEQLNVTWLIVDDGGYGILREYMNDQFGTATATELTRPDFARLAEAFGVNAAHTDLEDVARVVAEQLSTPGPSVVVLNAHLRMFEPTHRSERAPAWRRQSVSHGEPTG